MEHRWDQIGCEPFSNIVGGLSQEQKHIIYENNYYELQKYKKLEEALGCSLDVLFEALKNGIYVADEDDGSLEYHNVRGIEENYLSIICNWAPYPECDDSVYFKDYKKTWWLRKDKTR